MRLAIWPKYSKDQAFKPEGQRNDYHSSKQNSTLVLYDDVEAFSTDYFKVLIISIMKTLRICTKFEFFVTDCWFAILQ